MPKIDLSNEDWLAIEREYCARSLANFVKRAWHVLEPGADLKWGWALDAICEHLEAVHHRQIFKLLANVPPGCMKSLLFGVLFPAWEWGPMGSPSLRFLGTAHSLNLAVRDSMKCRRLIQSEWYQRLWPLALTSDSNAKVRFENDKTGFREAMAFTSMTGSRGDRVSVDDPLSVDAANSEVELDNVIRTFSEALPTRVNNELSAFLMIMQRLNERDPSGYVLSKELGYTHLCLPMEFEPERRCITSIGFKDPRTEEGELLFPERFAREQVEDLKKTLGSYACTPSETPILMSDLSMRPISDVEIGDELVGFGFGEVMEGTKYSRLRLKKTRVLNKYVYSSRPIVKITLDSGEVIRCTPDHKWFKKVRDGGEISYSKASVGSPLVRVCPPKIYTPPIERLRDAGWLAGFFDGDGSVSYVARHGNQIPVATIMFYQGAGRNGRNCEQLERILSDLGFDYSYSCDMRKDPKKGVNFEYRNYRLRGKTLPLMQKFLYAIQPVKWRERMVDGSYGAKFCMGKEKVVKIEPDGVEDVYALETETGNYFAWGLASSNSAGQLQQRPVPREGGMFNRAWFEIVGAAPSDCIYVRGWDLAASEKRKGQAGPAYTVGVKVGWSPSEKLYYIAHVARGQLSAGAVEKLITATASQDGKDVEVSLPQDPGQAGKAQIRYLVSALAGYAVHFSPESGSKEMRAEPAAAQAEAGNVKMVRGTWNSDFLDEAEMFPNSTFKDQVDGFTRAINRLFDKNRRQPDGDFAAPIFLTGGG